MAASAVVEVVGFGGATPFFETRLGGALNGSVGGANATALSARDSSGTLVFAARFGETNEGALAAATPGLTPTQVLDGNGNPVSRYAADAWLPFLPAGEYTLDVTSVAGSRESYDRFDLDNDGDLLDDAAALLAIAPTTDATLVEAYDVDEDGVVSLVEAQAFESIAQSVTAVYENPPILGDSNADYQLTCEDAPGSDIFDGRALSDPGYDAGYDADLDGVLDAHDRRIFGMLYSAVVPGDANFDGDNNAADLLLYINNGGNTVDPYSNGDVNGDGMVDGADLLIIINNPSVCP